MFVSEYDKSMINEILSKQDIYHITSLPWSVAARDCGPRQTSTNADLRNKWMHDNTGFFKSLDDYSNTFKRIDEYFEHGDAPYTLRQRINIINELLDCGFDTNLPLHVSFKPSDESYYNTTINLNDDSINNYQVIIHPGQTRAQGSVFTRTNLKNTLIYVKKEHGIDVKMNSSEYITKIESLEQLLKVYKPSSSTNTDNLTINFSTPGFINSGYWNGFKTHVQNDIIILKSFNIRESKNLLGGTRATYHSSAHYTYKSLKSINNFYTLLSNNRFTIYTSNTGWSRNKSKLNQINLYYKENKKIEDIDFDILNYWQNISNQSESYQDLVFNNPNPKPRLWDKLLPNVDTMFSDNEIKLLKDYHLFLSKNKELLKEIFANSKTFIFEPNMERVDVDVKLSIDFWKELVTRNEYKGICMYMHDSIIEINDRDIHEFLFCINSEVSMTRSDDNKVAIINCEHEYWKTGKNYKEWILPETFYTP